MRAVLPGGLGVWMEGIMVRQVRVVVEQLRDELVTLGLWKTEKKEMLRHVAQDAGRGESILEFLGTHVSPAFRSFSVPYGWAFRLGQPRSVPKVLVTRTDDLRKEWIFAPGQKWAAYAESRGDFVFIFERSADSDEKLYKLIKNQQNGIWKNQRFVAARRDWGISS
eukprot:s1569_g8.t1